MIIMNGAVSITCFLLSFTTADRKYCNGESWGSRHKDDVRYTQYRYAIWGPPLSEVELEVGGIWQEADEQTLLILFSF